MQYVHMCACWVRRGTVFWFCFFSSVYLCIAWDSPVRSSTTCCCKLDVFSFPFLLVNWPYVHEVAGNDDWSASTEYGSHVLIFHMDVKR